jgi:hypothetical protein
MMGMVKIESINSLFLPAGRQGGWGQSPALSNRVYFVFSLESCHHIASMCSS